MKKSFKLKNDTIWDSNDLRKLFRMVCEQEGYYPSTIEVITSRAQTHCRPLRVTGLGGIGYGWLRLGIPCRQVHHIYDEQKHRFTRSTEELKELSGPYVKRIAQVLAHEIAHNRGVREHSTMLCSSQLDINKEIEKIVIHKKPVKTKPKRNIRQERYNSALKKQKMYESKIKRYTNLMKKWGKKVKYYKKVMSE